ncbi:hypothetical protein [Plantactinospora sp. GCM10030261]|uniref:hypothetical protein n=1 Tax=Plantactinospora sp. GCM10030261 TaxID=3273420 RepID=UPI00361465F4
MKRPALPPRVEQTRALLVIQTWLSLLVLLGAFLLLPVMAERNPDTGPSDQLLVLYGSLMVTPALLALAAWTVRRGWTAGWVFALLAELAMAFVLYAAFTVGAFVGVPALLFGGLAIWVGINVFHPEVRHFFFSRAGRSAENGSART